MRKKSFPSLVTTPKGTTCIFFWFFLLSSSVPSLVSVCQCCAREEGIPSHPPVMSAIVGDLNKTVAARMAAKYDSKEETELRSWLSEVLPAHKTSLEGRESLQNVLKSGVILCQAINLIVPSTIRSISTMNVGFKQIVRIPDTSLSPLSPFSLIRRTSANIHRPAVTLACSRLTSLRPTTSIKLATWSSSSKTSQLFASCTNLVLCLLPLLLRPPLHPTDPKALVLRLANQFRGHSPPPAPLPPLLTLITSLHLLLPPPRPRRVMGIVLLLFRVP